MFAEESSDVSESSMIELFQIKEKTWKRNCETSTGHHQRIESIYGLNWITLIELVDGKQQAGHFFYEPPSSSRLAKWN